MLEIPPLLRKMCLAIKLVSDDYECEHVVDGLDFNARFADVYYALMEFKSDVSAAMLRLGIDMDVSAYYSTM